MIQRRNVVGAGMVMAAVVLFVVGMVSRARFVIYAAYVLVAAGLWLMARRSE